MTPIAIFITFAITWWMVFFMALPIGSHIPEHHEEGRASSAPEKTYLGRKLLGTTIVTIILTGLFYYSMEIDFWNFIDVRPH